MSKMLKIFLAKAKVYMASFQHKQQIKHFARAQLFESFIFVLDMPVRGSHLPLFIAQTLIAETERGKKEKKRERLGGSHEAGFPLDYPCLDVDVAMGTFSY